MSLWALVLILAVGSVLLGAVAFLLLRWFGRREPYRNFLRLRNRRKLTFVRLMIRDPRVPPYVKAVPFLLLLYLVSPIDLIPDVIPVLGYLDDVIITLLAFMLILKLTSGHVVQDLIQQAKDADAKPPGIHREHPQLLQDPPETG